MFSYFYDVCPPKKFCKLISEGTNTRMIVLFCAFKCRKHFKQSMESLTSALRSVSRTPANIQDGWLYINGQQIKPAHCYFKHFIKYIFINLGLSSSVCITFIVINKVLYLKSKVLFCVKLWRGRSNSNEKVQISRLNCSLFYTKETFLFQISFHLPKPYCQSYLRQIKNIARSKEK